MTHQTPPVEVSQTGNDITIIIKRPGVTKSVTPFNGIGLAGVNQTLIIRPQ